MGRLILDAYALVALLAEEPAAAEVEGLLRQERAAITAASLAETIDVLGRRYGVTEEELIEFLEPLVADRLEVAPLLERHAWRAAALRRRYYERQLSDLSLADCFLLAAAESDDRVASSDPALARAARAESIQVVALPNSLGARP